MTLMKIDRQAEIEYLKPMLYIEIKTCKCIKLSHILIIITYNKFQLTLANKSNSI